MRLLLIAVTILVTACVSKPSQKQIANADYGPFPYSYETIAKQYVEQRLKDPESVKYQYVSYPVQKFGKRGSASGWMSGYLVCIKYNAKNSFGGYAGYSVDSLLVKNGRVILEMFASDRYCG